MKSYIYFNAFDHLASSLNGILLRPDVKRITTPFLDTFEIDLAYLEKFASGLGDVSVGDAFAELRQTIAFLKSDNYEEYGNQQTRSKKYPRLRIQNAINLLEKLKGDTSVFSKTTPAEKEKRKKIETTVKTLRSQQGKDTSVAGSPSRGSQGW
ncbi:hypothetical protein HK104_004345 [Borealophlyctis nickersoniae]|nr:hypothetical protein HK104_004345 [Borealophlyctis nickersoniae]